MESLLLIPFLLIFVLFFIAKSVFLPTLFFLPLFIAFRWIWRRNAECVTFRKLRLLAAAGICIAYSVWFVGAYLYFIPLNREAEVIANSYSQAKIPDTPSISPQSIRIIYPRIPYKYSRHAEKCSELCAQLLVDTNIKEVSVGYAEGPYLTYRLGLPDECVSLPDSFRDLTMDSLFDLKNLDRSNHFGSYNALALGLCPLRVSNPMPVEAVVYMNRIEQISKLRLLDFSGARSSIDVFSVKDGREEFVARAGDYQVAMPFFPTFPILECTRTVEFGCSTWEYLLSTYKLHVSSPNYNPDEFFLRSLGLRLNVNIGDNISSEILQKSYNLWQAKLPNLNFDKNNNSFHAIEDVIGALYLFNQKGVPVKEGYYRLIQKLPLDSQQYVYRSLVESMKVDSTQSLEIFNKIYPLTQDKLALSLKEYQESNRTNPISSIDNYLKAIQEKWGSELGADKALIDADRASIHEALSR